MFAQVPQAKHRHIIPQRKFLGTTPTNLNMEERDPMQIGGLHI